MQASKSFAQASKKSIQCTWMQSETNASVCLAGTPEQIRQSPNKLIWKIGDVQELCKFLQVAERRFLTDASMFSPSLAGWCAHPSSHVFSLACLLGTAPLQHQRAATYLQIITTVFAMLYCSVDHAARAAVCLWLAVFHTSRLMSTARRAHVAFHSAGLAAACGLQY